MVSIDLFTYKIVKYYHDLSKNMYWRKFDG